ncbi:MAG: zinc-binding dehydrogenase, partial [Anaerolineae bacterium]|nr:zinc-binding dehydrogenase [Anaerolineae bacterium]
PLPEPKAGQVRIKSIAVGICATDLEMIAGWERTTTPNIPGHEWSGRIDAVGAGVDSLLIGKDCVAENVLTDGGEVGFEHSGAYGEYFLTEARNIHILPDNFPMKAAALIEPLAVVTRALKRLGLAKDQAVLIFGDGPIGLLSLMWLRQAGVEKIMMVGGREGRLALAQSLGASATFNFTQLSGDLIPTLQKQIGGTFPIIVEASGTAVGLENALQIIGKQGQLLLIGDYRDARANFPWNLLIHGEIQMMGSNASAGAWDEAVRLVVEEHLPLERLISHTFPAARFEEAFTLVRSQQDDVVKVVLEWIW